MLASTSKILRLQRVSGAGKVHLHFFLTDRMERLILVDSGHTMTLLRSLLRNQSFLQDLLDTALSPDILSQYLVPPVS